MKVKRPLLLPRHQRIMEQVGEQFKLARLRRKLSMEQVAERANISRSTLWNIEKGDPGVAIGNYYQVLTALGLEKDMASLASDDELGRKIQDAELITKKRAPKRGNE
ncbi:MAG: XRE family transcriptional regulator [Balneolaceae bacterium]|nr:MAG: XRE family transcriptional regulator [Balneolaceae bacterium]